MDRTTGAAPGARANAQRAAVLLAPPPGEGLAWGTPTPCGRSEGVLSSPPPHPHLLALPPGEGLAWGTLTPAVGLAASSPLLPLTTSWCI